MIKEKMQLIIRKALYGSRAQEKTYIEYLRRQGVVIGEGLRLFSPETIVIDIQNPHMITIGNNVRITKGCSILTHDYSFSVLAGFSGNLYSGIGSVVIHDNVFVGIDTIILRGSEIGENVIIGAKSLVSGKIEGNSVYAGVPAKKIMTIEEFEEKRKAKQTTEAKQFAKKYIERFSAYPTIEEMKEYAFLFGGDTINNKSIVDFFNRTGYEERVRKAYEQKEKPYDNFEVFLKDIGETRQ